MLGNYFETCPLKIEVFFCFLNINPWLFHYFDTWILLDNSSKLNEVFVVGIYIGFNYYNMLFST